MCADSGVAAERPMQAVTHRHIVAFGLICAEQLVPNQQSAAEIFAQVARIGAVMHAMIGRRYQPAVEPA